MARETIPEFTPLVPRAIVKADEHNFRYEALRQHANTHTHNPSDVAPGDFQNGTYRFPGTLSVANLVIDPPLAAPITPIGFLEAVPTTGAFALPNDKDYLVSTQPPTSGTRVLQLPAAPSDGRRFICFVQSGGGAGAVVQLSGNGKLIRRNGASGVWPVTGTTTDVATDDQNPGRVSEYQYVAALDKWVRLR